LLKKAKKQDKYRWYQQAGVNPTATTQFFSQHLWLALHGEETLLVLEGFLEPANMQEWEEETTDEL